MRRTLALLSLLPVGLAVAGCGKDPTGADARRAAFLKQPEIKTLKDEELARLCPSLYPSDFLARPKHYRYTRAKKRFVPSAALKRTAAAAGCTSQGTTPK